MKRYRVTAQPDTKSTGMLYRAYERRWGIWRRLPLASGVGLLDDPPGFDPPSRYVGNRDEADRAIRHARIARHIRATSQQDLLRERTVWESER